MIGAEVAGVVSDLGAVRATSRGTITIRAPDETQPARVAGGCLFWNARRPLEDHPVHTAAVAGAVGGGCSGI
jgi:hypothetical protein